MLNLFFWKKKKQTPLERAKELMPALLECLPEMKEKIRGIMNEGYITVPADGAVFTTGVGSMNGQYFGKLYDFIMYYHGAGFGLNVEAQPVEPLQIAAAWQDEAVAQSIKPKPKEDTRITAKPKDVEAELNRVPLPWDVDNTDLDKKIALLKSKSTLSTQPYVSAQIKAMIKRLENRKKYRDHREFYESFPNTDDDKIDELLRKYKLCLKTSDLFVPTFPDEAIAVMTKYKQTTVKLCGEEPVFYVIAEEADFKQKFKKLDPILLVQSPFGFYWQILGAWDKEMILLTEL